MANKLRKISQKDILIRRHTKQKSVWLKTPHETFLRDAQYNMMYDEEGIPLFTPVIHGVNQALAIQKIKQGAGSVEIDPETNEITQVLQYSLATKEEIAVHLEQQRRYRVSRQHKIHNRAMKKAKHIVRVNADDVNPIKAEDLQPVDMSLGDDDVGGKEPDKAPPVKPPSYDDMKKTATELGIPFTNNISKVNLQKKLSEFIAESDM